MDNLDKIDRAILRELQSNARITITELASRVGLSKTPCQIRMRRLEEQKYILGYTATLDFRKLGTKQIAFVQVSLDSQDEKAANAFTAAVHKISDIEQCHMVTGEFDYLIKLRASDTDQVREILRSRINTLPHVSRTSTLIVLDDVQDGGAAQS